MPGCGPRCTAMVVGAAVVCVFMTSLLSGECALASRAKPELDNDGVDGEADPEGDAEELLWREMGARGCGKEDAHDGSRGRDSKQNGDGAEHPALKLRTIAAAGEHESTVECKEIERVEAKDGGALDPSA